jgi:catechol 2,3-dioxygenase
MGASLHELFGDAARIVPATPGSYGVQPTGYRLPPHTHVGGVTLQVSDLARSRTFYEQTLGFAVLRASASEVVLTPHGSASPLVTLVVHRDRSIARSGKRLGLYHFAILLPTRADLGRFLDHLQQRGERAGASDHLVSEALYLQDPDDLGIEVYADRSRDTWKRRGTELVLATDPLDLRGLMAAAGETTWTGMPSGTTMGHVHLHVGDIELASRFYVDAIGFDRMVWSYPGALFLGAGGYHHHLGTNVWAGPDATAPAEHEPQLREWTLVVPTAADVNSLANNLRAEGVHVEAAAGEGSVVTRDPWGTAVRVVAKVREAQSSDTAA